MNVVPPVTAALAGLVLFFVPGLTLLALLRRDDREALEPDEALYLAVATSVLASAWIGLVLAELGRFSLVTAAVTLGFASGLALLLGRRRLAPPLRRPLRWRRLVPAALVLAVALALQARPSEYIVGGRDPGAYVAAMGLIGRTGGIIYTDPGVLSIPAEDVTLFYRKADREFSWSRFMGFDLESPATGRVFPQFFHLFPVFGAYLFQAMGVKGALATPPVFGVLGTLSAFFLFRRLWGSAPALLGGLLLAVNVVQVWFARYPVSETMSQFLVLLGMLAFLHWEERGSPLFGIVAGTAFGVSLLVRIDSVLIVVPIALYFAIRRMRRDLPWRGMLPVLVPFALLAIHAGLHGVLFTRKYLLDIANRPYWKQPPVFWLVLAGVLLVAALVADRVGPSLVRFVAGRGEALRTLLIVALAGIALYAYFLRPQISVWAGADGNDPALAWENTALLRRLGFDTLAAHDAQALRRVAWFVTPAGLALGVLGLLATLKDWRPRFLFPLLTMLTVSFFYLYKIRVYNDYYFALRRYVPVTLPFLLGLAAYFLYRLAQRGRLARAAAGLLAVALLAGFGLATARIARHVDWRNAVRFVNDVARRFGPEDMVIFEQPRSIHLLSLPLWADHGVNILELYRFNPDPERLRHLVQSWRGRYRNVYFVHTYRTNLCGLFLERVEDQGFGTHEWERSYSGLPLHAEPRALHFTISRVVPPDELQVPPLPEVDVGGSDDVQVSGFFDKEGGGEHTFRWTGACGSVYFPGARPGARLLLRAALGQRPATPPVTVAVSLNGVALGSVTPAADWADASVTLPDPLPPGPPVLRLDVPSFKPANVWPGDSDTRELGVMIDRIWLAETPAAERR